MLSTDGKFKMKVQRAYSTKTQIKVLNLNVIRPSIFFFDYYIFIFFLFLKITLLGTIFLILFWAKPVSI